MTRATRLHRATALALVLGLAVGSTAIGPVSTTLARLTDTDTSAGSLAADILDPPTGLVATGGQAVTLDWTPTVDGYASGYELRRSATSGGPYDPVASITPGTAATTSDGPGTGTWYYVLRSVYQAWSSLDSAEVSAAVVAGPVTTTEAPCTSTAADTSGAGDNDGYETDPQAACTDDGIDASDDSSGTGGNQSCGTGAVPDPRKDRHRFLGFATGLPGTATSIVGITIRADIGMNGNGASTVCAQLSWDAGTTWTALQSVKIKKAGERTYLGGGATDTWGRTWAVADFDPSRFQVRLVNASTQGSKRFDLDYVAVSVTYLP
jgi:hypothetical protein